MSIHAVNVVHQVIPSAPRPALRVGRVDDPAEHEADRIADEVMRMPDPITIRRCPGDELRRQPTDNQDGGELHPQPADVEEDEELQAAPIGTVRLAPTTAKAIASSRGAGAPLSPLIRMFFEPCFEAELSRVGIHSDATAGKLTEAVGARAFTVGYDVFFGHGHYQPNTVDGRRLIAHELTHVIQQEASRTPRLQRQGTGTGKEAAAREKILREFIGNAPGLKEQLNSISEAMRGFSLHQLEAMRKARVRFWGPDGLPPEFSKKEAAKVGDLREYRDKPSGQYLDTYHVIRIIPERKPSASAILHELAHAWDHVQTGKAKPLSETNVKMLTKEISGGKQRSVRLTIPEMFKRYKEWKHHEQSFSTPGTRKQYYSKTRPREFYAEGYGVFHGRDEENQARLLKYAPELYNLLEAEAQNEGLSVPDRSKLEEYKLP